MFHCKGCDVYMSEKDCLLRVLSCAYIEKEKLFFSFSKLICPHCGRDGAITMSKLKESK